MFLCFFLFLLTQAEVLSKNNLQSCYQYYYRIVFFLHPVPIVINEYITVVKEQSVSDLYDRAVPSSVAFIVMYSLLCLSFSELFSLILLVIRSTGK